MNSKPTSKKNSHLSLSNDYAEVNMETIPSESRQQSIQENSLSFYDSFSNHSTSSNHKGYYHEFIFIISITYCFYRY